MKTSEYQLHEALEGARGVTKSEGHNLELMEPKWGGKRSFLSVVRLYFHLPVSTGKIQRREPAGTQKSIKCVVNPG